MCHDGEVVEKRLDRSLAISVAMDQSPAKSVASIAWRLHPVRSFTHKRSPTGMRTAFWDRLAPVPAPFILNGTHQDYTDCSTHRRD